MLIQSGIFLPLTLATQAASRTPGSPVESAENMEIMPPLSEPHGNGRAYDKFQAIYDDMNAGDAAAEDNTNINVEA